MKRTIPNVTKRVEVGVTVANNQMERWERDGGVKFLKEIGLSSGQKILDFGCRVGHYTIPAAKAVGNEGVVYAVDKDSGALNELSRKVTALNLNNIRITKTSAQTNLSFESKVIDVVLLYDVLHYFGKNERTKLYHETFRVLKQGGLLSVYPKHTAEDNPTMELQHLYSIDVRREILSSGFQFERRYCGIMSHDDGLNEGCVFNFRKYAGAT